MTNDYKPKFSKTDARFWADKLFKRGNNPDWQVQIGYAGHQERIPLRTPNKSSAADRARDIWKALDRGDGWDKVRAAFKPWTNTVEKIDSPSVGEFLGAVETHGGINPITLKSYTRKFRRLVSVLLKIKGDASRFHRGEGSANWRKTVDAVKLAELTPPDINRWKLDFVAAFRG